MQRIGLDGLAQGLARPEDMGLTDELVQVRGRIRSASGAPGFGVVMEARGSAAPRRGLRPS